MGTFDAQAKPINIHCELSKNLIPEQNMSDAKPCFSFKLKCMIRVMSYYKK